MLACNMTGTQKLKPLIIGKYKNPRAFKNFDRDFFCEYFNNENAWIKTDDFNTWLYNLDLKFKKQNKKILLVLDNCSSHKVKIDLTHVEMLFLPKNSTSRLQPLDAGIIRSYKAKFYNYQMSSIVDKILPDKKIEDLYKAIPLKDAIIWTKYAWDDVSCETIKNCWRKSLTTNSHTVLGTEESLGINETIEIFNVITKHLFEGDTMEEKEYLCLDP